MNASALKRQLAIILKEMKSISDQIEACNSSSSCSGEGSSESLSQRASTLDAHTKPGREPSKAIILLMLQIFEALQNEPASEKTIKDFIAESCGQYGLKPTNRGSIAGANIEVSAACNILNSVGLIEPVTDPVAKRSKSSEEIQPPQGEADPSTDSPDGCGKWLFSQLSEILTARWHKALTTSKPVEEPPKNESGASSHPQLADFFSTVAAPGSSNLAAQESDHEMDFVDILLERSEHLVSTDLPMATVDPAIEEKKMPEGKPAVSSSQFCNGTNDLAALREQFPRSDSGTAQSHGEVLEQPSQELQSQPQPHISEQEQPTLYPAAAAESSENRDTALPASRTISQRRGPSSSRVWRVRSDVAVGANKQFAPAPHVAVLLNAESHLAEWSSGCFREGVAMELEERALRRVVTECGIKLPVRAFCVGTKYLKRSYQSIVTESVEATNGLSEHGIENQERSAGRVEALVTAEYIIDKVRRSKRQTCGHNAAGVNMFDVACVNKLASIAQRSAIDFWSRKREVLRASTPTSSSTKRNDHKKNQRPSGDPATLSECIFGTNSPTNISSATPGALLLAGSFPTVTVPMLRKYSKPLELSAVNPELVPMGAQSVVDLMLTTVEIPWKSLAAEFQTIDGTESACAGIPEAATATANQTTEASEPSERKPETIRKRAKLTHSQSNSAELNASGVGSGFRRRPSMDVLAPAFKNVMQSSGRQGRQSTPPPDNCGIRNVDDDEDVAAAASVAADMARVAPENGDTQSDEAEEDISDETYLALHEAVLRSMRERWAVIQQLKAETRREVLASSSGTPKTPGADGLPGLHTSFHAHCSSSSTSTSSSAVRHFRTYGGSLDKQMEAQDKTASFGANSAVDGAGPCEFIAPKEVKRRGRPPKVVRGGGAAHNGSQTLSMSRKPKALTM